MLVLSRRCNTKIYIGSDITVQVLEIRKRHVKLGIEAPSGIPVLRDEIQPIAGRGKPCIREQSSRR